jgi:hypothetical protein
MEPLTLAELIDLEVQLLDDRERDPEEIARRDAEIARKLGPSVGRLSRHELVRRWLAALAGDDGVSVGRRVSAFYRLAGWVIPIATFLAGVGTATGLLVYDGQAPVNIMGFLAVLVLLQIVLVVLTITVMLPGAWLGGLFRLTGLQGMIRELSYRRAGRSIPRASVGSRGRAALGHIAAWQTVYAGVERWMLTALTQRAALAFNVGALAATLYTVTVRALAFAWSTTLEIDTEWMTRFFDAIATPWRWLPPAVPTRELVAASRYFPGRSYDPDLLGDWWPFLVAALVTYGLLPRLVLAAYAAHRARAARRALTLDHGECAGVCERLTRPASLFERGLEIGSPVALPEAREGTREPPLPSQGTSVRALRWADAGVSEASLSALVARHGWRMTSLDEARGDEAGGDSALFDRLAAGDKREPILIVAEAFEPPSKSVQRLLRRIRERVGAQVPIVVGLCGGGEGAVPRADDVRIWRRRIAALGDPWLRVETLS